jgi:RNA polymerase sigma-70 factor (ECF subfamily)
MIPGADPFPLLFVQSSPMPESQPHTLEDLSDEQLLGRHRGGDEKAIEVLIERYRLELYHFLARFLGDRAAADDVFQEAFIQVHISAGTFDTSRRFKPWLFTIAANKARDLLRKNKRQKTASLSAMVDKNQDGGRAFIDLLEADLPLPGEKAQQKETGEIVRNVVASLPEHLREVLLLAYFNKMAYRDIAENLGIPLGTVKSRLHAAVGTFAELWKAQAGPTDQE